MLENPGQRPADDEFVIEEHGGFIPAGAPQLQNCWTPATFVDRAEELRRRLRIWHRPNPTEPVWCPSFFEFQEAIRLTFRHIIFKSDHGPKPEPGVQVFPGLVSSGTDMETRVGSMFTNRLSENDSHYTRWLLRDLYEHLSDAGTTAEAEYLRLTTGRILDELIYCGREPFTDAERHLINSRNLAGDDGPWRLIGGRRINPELSENLVNAARGLLKGATAVPVGEEPAGIEDDRALSRLLNVYTNSVSDEQIRKAVSVLESKTLKNNEKLEKIDTLLPIPPTATAEQLGKMLSVNRQAVVKWDWWIKNRRGKKQSEIGRREDKYRERGRLHESKRVDDEDN